MNFFGRYILGAILGGAIGAIVVNLLNGVDFWKGFIVIGLIIAFISNPIAMWVSKIN